jgi:hypothetical protein
MHKAKTEENRETPVVESDLAHSCAALSESVGKLAPLLKRKSILAPFCTDALELLLTQSVGLIMAVFSA